jgi:hypothetical protein
MDEAQDAHGIHGQFATTSQPIGLQRRSSLEFTQIACRRLTKRSVSLIVKDRVFKLRLRSGKTEAVAREFADAYSGHSHGAGYATTAGENESPAIASSTACATRVWIPLAATFAPVNNVEIGAPGVRVLTPPAAMPLQAAAAELNIIQFVPGKASGR